MLSGPNSSTCRGSMGNGEWEPDPREAACVDTSTTMHMTTERSFDSETLSQDGKIAVASSVTVFVVISILFFVIGFLSGHFCQKERTTADNKVAKKQIPYYDDVVLKQHEQELELKESVTYGPVCIR